MLKATHVAGRNTATLTVLAAGGTLPVAISYDGETVCSDVHAEFGQATTTVINAFPGKHSEYGTRSFTITGIDDSTNPFALNKISIIVTRDGDDISTIHSPQYYTNSIPDDAHAVNGATEDTSIPYAILIANPNWDWCDENVSIATQEGFVDWVEDASKCQWYEQGNTWGVSNEVPSNENVITGTTVYQKIPAAQFSSCTYGATVTFTISDFSDSGDLSFYTTYSGVEGASTTTALESKASISVSASSETTVTLELGANCPAFTSGLIVVYDNAKFKVSAISVTPAAEPTYGTLIESDSFKQGIGSPNNYPAFKISSSDIPTGKALKVTGVFVTGYAQIYCATGSYGAAIEFTVNDQNPLVHGSKNTSDIGSNDYFICIQNGKASDVKVYYTFE